MQTTTATSASDRYDAARALLAEWDAAATPNALGLHNAGGFAMHESARIREVLRALVEPAPIEGPNGAETERVFRAAYDRETATGAGDIWASAAGRRAIYDLGVQHSWEQWEPENAPGMVDTRVTETVDIVFDRLPDAAGADFIEAENADGASVSVGEWVTRPDGYAALRVEVVR